MRKRGLFYCLLGCSAMMFAVACGDDTDPPIPDTQVQDDMAIYDMGVDTLQPDTLQPDTLQPDLPTADMPTVDMPTTDMPTTDMPMADMATGDMPMADMSMADMAMADMASPDATVVTGNGTCAKAATITLVAGVGMVAGDTTGNTDEFAGGVKCSRYSTYTTTMDGPQSYFKFAGKAGQLYRITTTATSHTSYTYVFTSTTCTAAAINTDCQSDGATGIFSSSVSSNKPEPIYFAPTTAGDVYVAIDSTSSTTDGPFVLMVEEIATPTNTKCSTAQSQTFTSGKIKVSGDLSPVFAPDEFATLNCSSSTTLDGPNLYYKFPATAGKAYKMKVTSKTIGAIYMYYFTTTACTEALIETDCQSGGTAGDGYVYAGYGNDNSLNYVASTSGTVTVGIDYSANTTHGQFELEIEEITPPSNISCTAAQTMTLSGTPPTSTVSGDTSFASNEFGTSVDCGASTDYDGYQLYYKVTLAAGKTYKVNLKPTFSSYMYLFTASACSSAAAINTACGSAGTTGDKLYVSSSTSGGGTLFFTPSAGGDYVIAVDSSAPTTSGTFTLTVSEFTPAANSTCAKAQTLTLSGTPASGSVTGDTSAITDEFGTAVDCGGSDLDGPQVYYQVGLTAGTTYQIKLSPSFSAYAYVFRAASCSTGATAIDTDCGAGGGTGDVAGSISSGGSGGMFFTPTTSGNYFIAVDSTSLTSYGSFTLDVKEYVVPSFTAPLSWDFESSCQGLAATGDWECGQINFSGGTSCSSGYAAPTAGASGSGKGMWGTKLNDCYSPLGNHTGYSSTSCSNTKPGDDSILSFKVTIPSGWSAATLTYYDWVDVNGYFDWMEIRVNNTSVKAICNPSTGPTAWVKNTVDLSSYAGQTITVGFHFMASTVVQYAGWYLDDLSISGS